MRRWAAIGIAIAALVLPAAAAAFGNLEPLAARQWYLDSDRAWSFWPMQPQLFPVNVAVIDSGIDGTHPEFTGRVVAAKSFVGGLAVPRRPGPRDVRRGRDRREPVQRRGDRRHGVQRAADDRQGGRAGRLGLAQGRGGRDPLGGRQRRARDQPQPRRSPRSTRPVARHLFAARAGRRRVRLFEGRRRGCGGRQRAAVAGHALELRALSGFAAARDRRQRGAAGRLGAGLLEPRRRLQRSRGARRRDLLDHPDQPRRDEDGVQRDVPYSNCGPFEFQDAIGTSFAAPQVSAAAALLLGQDPTLRPEQVAWLLERSADDADAATGCDICPAGPRPVHRLGDARRRERPRPADARAAAAGRPLRAERQRRPLGACAAAVAAHDRRDARLLGRRPRRLPRLPAQGTAAVRTRHASRSPETFG